MLDWPLMEFLDCAWVDQDFQPGSGSNAKSQEALHGNGYSNRLYGSGGMVPTSSPTSSASDAIPPR